MASPRPAKGLSRNSFWRRMGSFLHHFLFYGEIRWKHASDSVIRLEKIERKKGPLENREMIRPRKEPLKPDRPIPRTFKRRDSEETPNSEPPPAPTPPASVPKPEDKPQRMLNPNLLIPARESRRSHRR